MLRDLFGQRNEAAVAAGWPEQGNTQRRAGTLRQALKAASARARCDTTEASAAEVTPISPIVFSAWRTLTRSYFTSELLGSSTHSCPSARKYSRKLSRVSFKSGRCHVTPSSTNCARIPASPHRVTLIDVSRTGCQIRLCDTIAVPVGSTVHLDFGPGRRMTGQVMWAGPRTASMTRPG